MDSGEKDNSQRVPRSSGIATCPERGQEAQEAGGRNKQSQRGYRSGSYMISIDNVERHEVFIDQVGIRYY